MSIFLKALEATYKQFGHDGKYVPLVGEPKDIRILEDRSDEISTFGKTRAQSEHFVFNVRQMELPSVTKGHVVAFGGDLYQVKSAVANDRKRLEWRIECFHATELVNQDGMPVIEDGAFLKV